MRMRHAAIVAGLILGSVSTAAHAAYVLDIYQMGANVLATGSGSIDTGGVTSEGNVTTNLGIFSNQAFAVIGGSQDVSLYNGGIFGSSSFGSGPFTEPSSSTGSTVGIYGSGGDPADPFYQIELYVPANYQSGSDLGKSTAVFDNTTLAALGLTTGSVFVYSIPGSGETIDTFTVNIGVSPVPLPASAPMFAAALLALGAVGYGVKRKKAAASA